MGNPTEESRSFGQWLKQRRRSLDITQEELGRRANCAAETVRRIEAGTRRPSKAVALALAGALELTADERDRFLRLARSLPDFTPTALPAQTLPTTQSTSTAHPSTLYGDSVPLLAAKFYRPRPRAQLVARPRLLARLEGALAGPLTVIAAPAGFGKTTLLADWLSQSSAAARHVAWLTLEASDSDPMQFLRYLLAALQTVAPAIGTRIAPLLRSPQPPPLPSLLPVLANELVDLPGNSLLVLDDYHALDSPGVQQIVAFLLEHLPPQLHLVISGRVDPPLPLARLRARGQLVELRAGDLRFTADEAQRFLQDAMGLRLSATAIAAVEARTEGWIAGLQLAALSLQELPAHQVSAFIDSFTGSHRFVVDYLADEVLACQPAHLHTFLLQTSILERLSGPLCDAVTGAATAGSQQLLEHLERVNLFLVPLDEERRWYRYHHLFAQVLRSRLAATVSAGEVAALHRRAAAWLQEQGHLVEAVNHMLAAQDWEGAARLIEAQGLPLIVQGHSYTLEGWLQTLPSALLAQRPRLLNLRATLDFNANQLAAAEQALQAAEAALAGCAQEEESQAAQSYVLMLRANIARACGNLASSVAFSSQSLAKLSSSASWQRAAARLGMAQSFMITGDVGAANQKSITEAIAGVRSYGSRLTLFNSLLTWAEFQRRQGALQQAASSYRQANEVASNLFGLEAMPNGASYYCGWGSILREWNELELAEQQLLLGQEMIRSGRQTHGDFVTLGYIALARLHSQRGDGPAAFATLRELHTLAHERHFAAELHAQAVAAEADIARLQGDLAAALSWAEGSALSLDDETSYAKEQPYLVLARIRITQAGRDSSRSLPPALLGLLDRLHAEAERSLRRDSLIQILAVRALALEVQNEQQTALQALNRALELAAPQGYCRVFLDEGPPMARLLYQGLSAESFALSVRPHAQSLLETLQHEPLTRKLAAASSVPAAAPILGGETLTARELEVLQLLAAGQSNLSIAQRLVVEVGTVKRHVSNIMDKLQAQSRLEAVARARSLKLLKD